MNLFQIYRNLILPLIILNIAVEVYFLLPTSLAEQTAHFLLDGRRDEACTVAILIIIVSASFLKISCSVITSFAITLQRYK